MDFSDRHVVVTGGTGALGTAVVSALLQGGAVCHVPYIDEGEAARFALRAHDRVNLIANAELTDESAVARLYAAAPRLWASIHLAGGFAMTASETRQARADGAADTNFVACFLCCPAAVQGDRPGRRRIVNVAARPALEWRRGAGMAAYAASKAAVAALTVALAEEVVKEDILVNAVAPSTMDTPANRKAMPNADHAAWAKVEDVAATILFLASPENRVTRGAVVPVYGRS